MSRAQELKRGDTMLAVENVSLRFGGVKAITDVSFDIRKGEIRAIIGPNGAGKTSMLNVINGFYHPQEGRITYKGVQREKMRPFVAASQGIARTFQNVALFKGMTTLDNIMVGRTLKMKSPFFWQIVAAWPGDARGGRASQVRRGDHRLPRDRAYPQDVPVGKLPYGLQKRVELGRALAMEPELLLLDEPMAGMNLEEKEDMCRFILDVSSPVRHDDRADRARHGRGDGPQPTGWWCSNTAARSPTARRTRSRPTRRSSTPISASGTEGTNDALQHLHRPVHANGRRRTFWSRRCGKGWSRACSMR
jgi:branched-chain amino acid transport system ATP-binding protein